MFQIYGVENKNGFGTGEGEGELFPQAVAGACGAVHDLQRPEVERYG